ncbi:MAG: potassium channel family protein [Candidatus Saccharimonadales bacterium]|jgi:voltage-gated potassium channel Kch
MDAFNKHAYRFLFSAVLFMLTFGTIFYHITEKLTWVNAYYFSVVTLSTVGYGDITPHTNAGKLFTTFYIFAGVGVITAFLSAFMRRQGVRLEKRAERKRGEKESGDS